MSYDDALELIGTSGRYQLLILLLLYLPVIQVSLHSLAGVFLKTPVPFRCKLPNEPDDATYSVLPEGAKEELLYPWSTKFNRRSQCLRYDAKFDEEYYNKNKPAERTVKCTEWVYDHSDRTSTVISEWDLVCDKAWLTALADTCVMLGYMIGSAVFGNLSDRYGRKPCYYIALVLQTIIGVLAAFVQDVYTHLLTRLLLGTTGSAIYIVGYVNALELLGPDFRVKIGAIYASFFALAYIVSSGYAFMLRDWRMYQLGISLPGFIYFSYWWCIPESGRWLMAKGKVAKAKMVLLKIAKRNKKTINEAELDKVLEQSEAERIQGGSQNSDHKPSFLDLCRYPNIRKRAIVVSFIWPAVSGSYYGLGWSTPQLGGNEYINFVISGSAEILSYIGLLFTVDTVGRRTVLCTSMVMCGLFLISTAFVPFRMSWLTIALAMCGKFTVSAAYGVMYIFTVEQFPTVIRNIALGTASTSARIGSMLAPFINLTWQFWSGLPLVIFGIVVFICGVLVLLLPETLKKKLPDSILEAENYQRI